MRSSQQPPRVIVIGASSGGTDALRRLLATLPVDLPAALLLVRHQPDFAGHHQAEQLAALTRLPVRAAADGAPIESGCLFVAPADRHLLVDGDQMVLSRGPRENRARPAVDPLFRSAAMAHGPGAIGVILSGRLDDGTAGLLAVKRCGGIAVVQDPADAEYPDMPRSALRHVDVDHCLPAGEIGPLLAELAAAPPLPQSVAASESLMRDWRSELAVQRQGTGDIPTARDLGEPVPASCPECGGPLWEMGDGLTRFRCHTGHAFTARHLAEGLGEAAEVAIWAALRVLDERGLMLRRMAEQHARDGRDHLHEVFATRAAEAEEHVAALRALLRGALPSRDAADEPEPDPER